MLSISISSTKLKLAIDVTFSVTCIMCVLVTNNTITPIFMCPFLCVSPFLCVPICVPIYVSLSMCLQEVSLCVSRFLCVSLSELCVPVSLSPRGSSLHAHGDRDTQRCFVSMCPHLCPHLYVSTSLSVPISMCPHLYVSPSLVYVSPSLCVPISMCPQLCVSPTLCVPISSLCVPISTCPHF